MTDQPAKVLVGDTVTMIVRGKIVDPSLAGTPLGTTVLIKRPSVDGVNVDVVLDSAATVTYTVESQFKNGVHIDAGGRYWMRTPKGWFEMSIADAPAKTTLGEFVPRGIQRLKEDRAK